MAISYRYTNLHNHTVSVPGPTGVMTTFAPGQWSTDPWYARYVSADLLTQVQASTPVPPSPTPPDGEYTLPTIATEVTLQKVEAKEVLNTRQLLSSGSTAKSAGSDAAITLIVHPGSGAVYPHSRIRNDGNNDALCSIDGGLSWFKVGALETDAKDNCAVTDDVLAKNLTAGQNITGMWAEIW